MADKDRNERRLSSTGNPSTLKDVPKSYNRRLSTKAEAIVYLIAVWTAILISMVIPLTLWGCSGSQPVPRSSSGRIECPPRSIYVCETRATQKVCFCADEDIVKDEINRIFY